MPEFKVNIVQLPPMKAASFYAFGKVPELAAFENAETWLRTHGLYKKGAYRHFGFNNPHPTSDSQEYGYEVWILPSGKLPEDKETKIVDFPGGLYAITECTNVEFIRESWQQLFDWCAESEYHHGDYQGLEEVLDPPVQIQDLRFLLYLPIARN